MRYNESEAYATYQKLREDVEEEVRYRARVILENNPDLVEFVKSMGEWFFVNRNGDYIWNESRFNPVDELISNWDETLVLTGIPVRFKTKGPEVYDW